MGQTLSEPVLDKHTSEGGDERYIYGASAMQGWRISMEDAHTTLLKLGPDGESAFFAVYDGHGGQSAAIFAGEELHEFIINNENYKKGDFEAAIKAGYITADAKLREDPRMNSDPSGCTAVGALLTKDGTVYCGNAGDSRCIISTKGRAIALSSDHKPTNEVEFNRITSGGGFVEFGRVNGNLALSRAIGDFEFKNNNSLSPERQIVTANPDVVKHKITVDDEFIVVACDGIWDCMTNQQVAQFVHEMVAKDMKLPQICEELMDRCLASESELGGVGCDNMTVVIVGLLNGKTEEEWYAHVKRVYEESDIKVSTDIDRSTGATGAAEDQDSEAAAISALLARVKEVAKHSEEAAAANANASADPEAAEAAAPKANAAPAGENDAAEEQ
ncbi:PP2C-domain-containing protein [Martensiomyces pterosporus]|nr:PP2C-domain-containing protein [Martensiomyces pterosporus]